MSTILNLYFDTVTPATEDGVFIPLTDLPGIQESEWNNSDYDIAMSKGHHALVERLYTILSSNPGKPLGSNATKSSPSGVAINLFRQTYTFTFQKHVDYRNHVIQELPVVAIGSHAGENNVNMSLFFPNAIQVNQGDTITALGLVIPNGAPYIGDAQLNSNEETSLFGDIRSWITATAHYLALHDELQRSTTRKSAIVNSSAGNWQSISIPPSYIDPTNPITGIVFPNWLSDDAVIRLAQQTVQQRTVSVTLEFILDYTGETFNVNAVTS